MESSSGLSKGNNYTLEEQQINMDGYSEDLETTSLLHRHNRKTSTAVPKLYSETKHGIETARMGEKGARSRANYRLVI